MECVAVVVVQGRASGGRQVGGEVGQIGGCCAP